jgi:hypothetical protein
MKPNEQKWTRHEILQMLLAPRPKPQPKPAAQLASEHWAKKPTEAVIRDEAAHNEAVLERLREKRQAERRGGQYQMLIDRVWQNQLNMQASLRELGRPSFHKGPGDPDW